MLFWRLFKGVLKFLENVQEKLCYRVTFTLHVFKVLENSLITCAMEFLFTEAGANIFITEKLF